MIEVTLLNCKHSANALLIILEHFLPIPLQIIRPNSSRFWEEPSVTYKENEFPMFPF